MICCGYNTSFFLIEHGAFFIFLFFLKEHGVVLVVYMGNEKFIYLFFVFIYHSFYSIGFMFLIFVYLCF